MRWREMAYHDTKPLTQYVTLARASRLIGISEYKLKKAISAGLLVATGGGNRPYRINIDDLEIFINYAYEKLCIPHRESIRERTVDGI